MDSMCKSNELYLSAYFLQNKKDQTFVGMHSFLIFFLQQVAD